MTDTTDPADTPPPCVFCGRAGGCPCYDESEHEPLLPDDSTTNPARWGGEND